MSEDGEGTASSPYVPRPTAHVLDGLGRDPTAVLDHALLCVGILDEDGAWVWASPELERLLQRNIEPGAPFWLPDQFPDLEGVVEGMSTALASPGEPIPVRGRVHVSAEGFFVVEGTLTSLFTEAGVEGLLLSIVDVTDRVEADLALQQAASQDPMTGLPNRFVLDERLSDALARARRRNERFAVLYFDLDNFKAINDTLGHEAGDTVLVEVAQRLRDRLRAEDVLARVGGDEFVIVTGTEEDLSPDKVRHLCDLIRDALAVPVQLDVGGREVITTASIGVVIDDGHRTPAELLRDADVAMYEAKNDGRSGYSFHSRVMTQHAIARARFRDRVAEAVANGSVVVHYQPIVDVTCERVLAYEALARIDLAGSLVFPDEFLPAVESAGVMADLGALVLTRALQATEVWDESVAVSVNVTADTLRGPGFVDVVRNALDEERVAPSRLVLELHESVLTSGDNEIANSLRRLRRLGVRIGVDHFGAGIQALRVLEDLLVSWVKIDGDLISDLERSSAAVLVAAATSFAEERGLLVVAERVETETTKRWLVGSGIRYVQGFASGRPAPLAPRGPDEIVDVTSTDATVGDRTSR